jgi:hypothetical protein
MSHLANALSQLLTEAKKTAAAVSHASGITAAQLSRLRNGRQVWVSPEDLRRIATGICPDNLPAAAKTHAQLLHARLQDDCTGPGAEFLRIEMLLDITPSTTVTRRPPVLPPKAQANFATIAGHFATNRHVRDLVEVTADFCHELAPLPAPVRRGYRAL